MQLYVEINIFTSCPELLPLQVIRGGVEIQGSRPRPRPRIRKKSEANNRLSKDRLSRGQGQECSRPRPKTKDTTRKCSLKKRSLCKKISNFLRSFRRRKKGHDLDPFLTNQRIVLSSPEDRAFSRTCRP